MCDLERRIQHIRPSYLYGFKFFYFWRKIKLLIGIENLKRTHLKVICYCTYRHENSRSPRHSSRQSCLELAVWFFFPNPLSRYPCTRSKHQARSQGFMPRHVFCAYIVNTGNCDLLSAPKNGKTV